MSSDTLVANDRDAWTIALVGARGVGKTRFISRFVLDDFEGTQKLCIRGAEARIFKTTGGRQENTIVSLLDIYHGMNDEETTGALLRDADAFILMYSTTSPYSLQDVVAYTRAVRRAYGHDPLLALVANKCDRPAHDQEVSYLEGKALAEELDCVFAQASAKTGDGVQAVVTELVRALRSRKKKSGGTTKRAFRILGYLSRR